MSAAGGVIAFAPGRVNLIGEHTDYNDGFVLPAAIDRGVTVAARRVPGDRFTVHAAEPRDTCSFTRAELARDPRHPWADYFKGVVWALSRRGFDVAAVDATVSGDLPRGAGLSSSAAYEVATVLALRALGGFELPAQEVARAAREAENGFVGVACGIMDQMASTFGAQGRALLIDCRSLAHEGVELPPQLKIVVANSGVRHELASSAYNQRRAECDEAARVLATLRPGARALRDVQPADEAPLLEALSPTVRKRCRHIVRENARVLKAVTALRANDLPRVRALMAASHASLRDEFEVSCPELDVLVDLALAQPTCHGARLTGAGFGGSTVNLVEAAAVDAFSASVAAGYRARTGRSAELLVFEPSAGARLL